jgi:hypothetical protein
VLQLSTIQSASLSMRPGLQRVVAGRELAPASSRASANAKDQEGCVREQESVGADTHVAHRSGKRPAASVAATLEQPQITGSGSRAPAVDTLSARSVVTEDECILSAGDAP